LQFFCKLPVHLNNPASQESTVKCSLISNY
jgi:hypothetical protein